MDSDRKNGTRKNILKVIKIFIASQSSLAKERDFIENLIHRNNDDRIEKGIFVDKGIYLKPIRWELSDKGNGPEEKQKEFNESLLDSEIAIYLTWDSIGHYTKEEFEIGYNSMKNGEKPKRIYVFNKKTPQIVSDLPPQSIQDYREIEGLFRKEGKIIADYTDEYGLSNEFRYLLEYIENN
jgi:hypothetical protein